MKKVLKYVLLVIVLMVVIFTLTGCGNKEIKEEIVVENEKSLEGIKETEEKTNEDIPKEISFKGIYIATDELDTMEGLIIVPDGPDNVIVMKDVQGTGIIRAGGEKIQNNSIEHEFLNEEFYIKDIGENVKFYHPRFCVEEIEMVPATGEFVGVYENEMNRLAIYKNLSGEMTVVYMDIKYDNALSATMKDFTITETTLEGNDDAYNEPIKITLNGDKLTFNIESEDSRWNKANLEYTLVK